MTKTHWIPNHFVPVIENAPRTESEAAPHARQPADDGEDINTSDSKTSPAEELPLPVDCLGHWVIVRTIPWGGSGYR